MVHVVLQIQGQILPAPLLQYGPRTVDTNRRPGSWEPGKYSVPGKMPSYAIASFADRRGTENAMRVSSSSVHSKHIAAKINTLAALTVTSDMSLN